ncbi:hypothetical protein Taro_056218, partial [Colocasia esculenta]|nr:hypothetical protein [Colocasia esculenta]
CAFWTPPSSSQLRLIDAGKWSQFPARLSRAAVVGIRPNRGLALRRLALSPASCPCGVIFRGAAPCSCLPKLARGEGRFGVVETPFFAEEVVVGLLAWPRTELSGCPLSRSFPSG